MNLNNIIPQPTVSIGMVVYYSERFLNKAIDSILRQSFIDYELIISDDSSIDICHRYNKIDSRIIISGILKNLKGK